MQSAGNGIDQAIDHESTTVERPVDHAGKPIDHPRRWR
jgi:hypothetical protein